MSGLTPEDEALLRSARLGLEPTDTDRTRIERKVLGRLGLGLGVATSALSSNTAANAAAPMAAAAMPVMKVIGALLVVGGLVGTGALALRASRPLEQAPAPHASSALVAVAPNRPTPRDSAPARISPPMTTPMTTTPSPSSSRVLAAAPPAPPALARRDVAASTTAPPAASHAVSANDVPPLPASTAPMPPQPMTPLAGPATVAAEAQLLREADTARRAGDAKRALALLNEHVSSFPNGTLAEERDAERVVVLCALGQTDEAREAASAFVRDHARSPLVARVRASCVGPAVFVMEPASSAH
jgi:hypothetical protein